MKRVLLAMAILTAFESFGFGFLLDAAKLPLVVTKRTVECVKNCGRVSVY